MDHLWYRCIITNCDHNYNKYELFYIDFGNTEVASRDDLLFGFQDEHVQVFKNFASQAFKCKMYQAKAYEINKSEECDNSFKYLTTDKLFGVNVIGSSCDETGQDILEIELNELDVSDVSKTVVNGSVHKRLIDDGMISMDTQINRDLTASQIRFYTSLFNSLNPN